MEVRHDYSSIVARGFNGISTARTCEEGEGWPAGSATFGAGALVTYGGVSLFVAFFVLAPMAQELFRVAGIPRRLMPAAIVLGTSTFTM